MPVTNIMNLVLDTQAKAEKWFTMLDSSAGTEIAYPEWVNAGANSYIRFVFAENPVAVAKLFRTKALMDADLAHADGVLVNCADADPAKRGRYEKDGASGGGAWVRVGDLTDKAWEDKNHHGRTLEILAGSWNDKDIIGALVGPQGWSGPADGDWTNLRITLDMQVIGFHGGPWMKMFLHLQGNVPRLTAVLPQVHGLGNWAYANYLFTGSAVSDQLGFGVDSVGLPNAVPHVENSNRVNVVLNFSAEDEDWECLGRIDRPLADSPLHYVAAPIAEVAGDLQGGNLYLLAVHDMPPASDAAFFDGAQEPIGETNRVRGELRIFGIKIDRVT
jgi:hypothetical protein